jgi:nitrate reductase NapE component
MAFGVHDHPFYRPLWRRIAIVATTLAWAAFEMILAKDGLWTVLASATFVYSVWAFLLVYTPPPLPPEK